MSDELEIYGVCRQPGCGHIWTTEPEGIYDGPPICPGCGYAEWPMSPREASERRSVPNGRFTNLPCPKCEDGKLKGCRSCFTEAGPTALNSADAYICNNPNCGEHTTGMHKADLEAAARKREGNDPLPF